MNVHTILRPDLSLLSYTQASFWDHYSFRSPETGSWFIQSLCSAIDSAPPDESLMDILMGVSRHVALNKVNNKISREYQKVTCY